MADEATAGKIGRPVRVVSISFGSKTLNEIVSLVDCEGAKGADLIALPETSRGTEMEPLDGPTVTAMAALARKHRTYVVCPIYRKEGRKRLNTAVLLDRQGQIAMLYDVEQEQYLNREQWFVLRAKRPGVSVQALAREYGLEELRDYIERSRRDIDRMRGSRFAGKAFR